MPAFPFAARHAAPPPAHSLGTSGTFHVPDPSPSLNEAALGEVEARDATRQAALGAMGHARAAAADAMRRARLVHVDPNISPAGRHRQAAERAAQSISPAVDTLAKAQATYAKELAELGEKLAGPKGDFTEMQLFEIRTKLSGMTPTARFAAIRRSIERGGDATVAALVNADPLVSDGLVTEPERAEVMNLWRKARFLDEHARHQRLSLDAELLEKAGKILASYQRSCYNDSVVNAPPQPTEHRGAGPKPLNRGAMPNLEDRAKAMTATLAGLAR
jgi:hypothetical protein